MGQTYGENGEARNTDAPEAEQLRPPTEFLPDTPAADVDAAPPAKSGPLPEPEVVGNAVALVKTFDVVATGEEWPHDFLDFKNDHLGIRLPTRQALAAFSLASGKYIDPGVKNDLTGLFIARHLSPESYGRVFSRLMDPDEDDYDVETVGELFNGIVLAAINADKAAEAATDDTAG